MTPIIEWLSSSSCHQRRLFSSQGSATCEGLLFIWICTHNNLRLLYIQGGWSPQCQSIFWHDRLWNPQFMVRDWYLSRICWCHWRANILYQLLAGSRPFSSNLSDFPPFVLNHFWEQPIPPRDLWLSFHCCSFNFIVFFSGLPEPSFITPSVHLVESARCKSLRLMWIQTCNTLHLHWIVCCWHHRRRYFSSHGRSCYLQVTAIHLGLGSITTFPCCTS